MTNDTTISTIESAGGDAPADTHPTRCDDWIRRELDGEAIFYDIATDTTCRLNGTALLIWQLCDGSTSMRNIVERIVTEYDVRESQAGADVRETLLRLRTIGLLSATGENA